MDSLITSVSVSAKSAVANAANRANQTRLLLAEHPALRDHLHGAWWPHSGDITSELAPLLRAIAGRARRVVGVALNRDEWPGAPVALDHTITGRVKVSWYGLPEPHLMVLRLDHQQKLVLLVVPPDTLEDVAVTAMLMASRAGNDRTAADLLAHAKVATRTRNAVG